MFGTGDPAYEEVENNKNALVIVNLRQYVRNAVRGGQDGMAISELERILEGETVLDNRSPDEVLRDFGESIRL